MMGVGSRRDCDQVIASGRVAVDGRTVREPGTQVIPGKTRVSVDGSPLARPPRPMVLVLNKPAGYVTTAEDESGRPTVLDLCRSFARGRRLFPVGRLDVNTTGVILLTNDGILCYRLSHPRFGIPRVYVARVRGEMDEQRLRRLSRMARLEHRAGIGERPPVELLKELGKESILRITLYEGRNRQVRKMCESVGLRIVHLKRVQFGPISARGLPPGAFRPLEPREIRSLRKVVSD